MRIIAGRFRGRTLASVGKGDTAAHLRPTTDRVRETLFNVLAGGAYGDPLTGATVLDLFAGTGALGLEALSRGASSVSFVDNGRKAQALIAENIKLIGAGSETTLLRRDATKLGPCTIPPATLVFLDPPYGLGMGEMALAGALAGGWIAADALIVWEENAPMAAPAGLTLLDRRRYGDTHVTFLTRPDPTPQA